ncbi:MULTISPECIES: thiopurine S-methyltransferase [Pseudomonas syringae group]|uniref:Thiopurine S-methyltransferase n=2 Tax=Pseudomonas syringae group TaxID=136849 RepID=A0A0P9YZH6_PSESI|nr:MULTISPECIES: thiopurine S-methyltransferase [Pseudomonas syringae group]EKN45444.1 thiopurine S-methyltransferase [Pseudomonas viridiflava UASWS0038]KPL63730.1 thiopurine S-methyltransferase [Pseudomonas viridiflava]KPY51931.1 Thiopurine S-methyltransferase [Pseudomonas syringae pv. ribicola]KPZ25482.1 Thiopurine S-methyltransferase [Pseudomonas viridiflava]OAG91850.1 thiopurine S-methyltransferase [Pseudomonas viridiflava]
MDAEFWRQRWTAGQIGFHQADVNQDLRKLWPELELEKGARVLVPLCGKSHDMSWLVEQGFQVVGVELSQTAVEGYFAEHRLEPQVTQRGGFTLYSAPGIDIWCGDFFALTAEDIGVCAAFYDRAAMIALPSDMRERYVRQLEQLMPPVCRGLLITLDYDQAELDGPPFSVSHEWLQAHVSAHWNVTRVSERDALQSSPRALGVGVRRMDECVYWMERLVLADA